MNTRGISIINQPKFILKQGRQVLCCHERTAC